MEKSYTKRYLHISHRQIITYICYTALLIGWHAFNCTHLFGVMSVELLSEKNASTMPSEVLNLSLDQRDSFSSDTLLAQKRSMDNSNVDFETTNPIVDNTPIQGWECFCWNITTTGSEVKYDLKYL